MTDLRSTPAAIDAEDPRYQRLLLFLVMGSVMAFGSLMTIVTIALGEIAADLDSSRATLTWVVTGLMLAMAVATPLAGKIGDVRGHRKMFLVGLGGIVITTVACGFAWNAASLIAFRVLFGLAGALVMPSSMSLMMHAYGPQRRATAMGWFQFAMTGAPTIGLVLGGPMIDYIGWRNMFFVFAAVTVVAFLAAWRYLRPAPTQDQASIDYLGGLSLAASVLAGLLAITRLTTLIRDEGLSTSVSDALFWILVAVAAVGLMWFVRTERRAAEPMLRLDYFGRPNFTLPMISAAMVQFAYMGGFVVIPALLTDQYHWSLGAIALLLAPRPAAFSLSSPIGGFLPDRIGQKMPIVVGAVAMICSTAAFVWASAYSSGFGIGLILAGLILAGVSAGISQPSVMAMVVDNVDESDMGIANGMAQQVMFIGLVTGIQTMNVLAGDNAGPGRFALTFGVGTAAAVVGLAAALAIRNPGRFAEEPSAAGDRPGGSSSGRQDRCQATGDQTSVRCPPVSSITRNTG